MTVLIPLRNHDNGNQLRFALRSITTHHPEINRCILVGGCPEWYTGEWVSHKDYIPDRKEENIRDKVLAGSKVLGEFLMANDDHILLAPIRTTWNKGLLSETLRTRNPNGSYARLLVNTMQRYGDVSNVDTHCPMWMTGEGVQRTAFEWPRFGIGFKTCYAQENGIQSEYMEDCKVDKGIPAGREWFSISDIYRVKELQNIFPTPCKFEIDYISSQRKSL